MKKRVRQKVLLAVFAVFTMVAGNTYAKTWTGSVDQDKAHVEFHAKGKPTFLSIVGKPENSKGKPSGQLSMNISGSSANVTGELSVNLNHIDTGISLRNRHMREKYLQTDLYPEVKLQIQNLSFPAADLKKGKVKGKYKVQGVITIKGITKPVQGEAKLRFDGKHLSLETEYGLDVTDFGIEIPNYAGITVEKDILIQGEVRALMRPSTAEPILRQEAKPQAIDNNEASQGL